MNWNQLADRINTTPGHQLVRIGFVKEIKSIAYQTYERALVLRVATHENLFSMHLGWEAFFEPLMNRWLWANRPRDDGKAVNILDGDITGVEPLDLGGGLFRIAYNMWTGTLTNTEINPASIDKNIHPIPQPIRSGESHTVYIEGGIWIVPPNYRTIDPSFIVDQSFLM